MVTKSNEVSQLFYISHPKVLYVVVCHVKVIKITFTWKLLYPFIPLFMVHSSGYKTYFSTFLLICFTVIFLYLFVFFLAVLRCRLSSVLILCFSVLLLSRYLVRVTVVTCCLTCNDYRVWLLGKLMSTSV